MADDRRSYRCRLASRCADESKINRIDWNDQAAEALEEAARGDLDWIAKEVKEGVSRLYEISGGSEGYLVTRQEPDEYVIVAGAGSGCESVAAFVAQKALAAGYPVRAHIQRKGLQRIFERIGFSADEIVMRVRPDGQ